MTASSFVTPRRIVYGEGALANATAQLAIMGAKALVVTDSVMVKLGNLARVTDVLDAADIAYHVYDEVNSEPVDTMLRSPWLRQTGGLH